MEESGDYSYKHGMGFLQKGAKSKPWCKIFQEWLQIL
jgi:hypothetical protein